MGDFPFLYHLSLKYLDKTETTKHWTDYVRAHGMLNACLARDPTREDIKRRIYRLESHWYNGSHPKAYLEYLQRIADHKCQLRKLRDNTEQRLDILEPLQASLSTDTLFSRENIIQLMKFSDGVFKMSSDCTTNLVEFSRSIIISSMDLLEDPPCSFAVVGLGSLARGEATPYSDLEFGFIVESGFSYHKYFTDLAVESYFCIGNLGESPLKCFYIEELNVGDEKGAKLFVDQPPVNGFKIDGISPKAGNIPTGHGREGGKRLILSVDELMSLYKSSHMAPADPDLPGDMSDLLFSPVLIFGHKGGEELLDQFIARRKVYESSVAATDPRSKDKRLNTLATDITQHPFIPEFEFGECLKSSSIHVKSDIFRYPTLLLANLKILSNLDTNYPWETVQWFQDNNALSPGNSAYLKIILGLSIFIRTKAYVTLGSQYELLSLQPVVEGSQHDLTIDRFHVPQAIFLTLGCLSIPIKRSIEKSIVKARSSSYHLNGVPMPDVVRSVLREFHVVDDFLLKAEVLRFIGLFNKAFEAINSAVGEGCVFEAIKFQQSICRAYPDQQSNLFVKKSLQMMASILLSLDRHKPALDYFSWLSFYSESDAERIGWDIHSAQSLIALEKFKSAESVLRQIEIRVRNVLSIEISKPLYTHAISLLKSAGEHKSCIDAALTWSDTLYHIHMFCSGVRVRVREGSPNYQQALEDMTRAEQILDARGEIVDIRRNRLDLYNEKGAIHQSIGEYDESEKVYTKSLAICRSLYGLNAANGEIASVYSNIAILYMLMGKYSQAEPLAKLALKVKQIIFGNNHLTSMLSLLQLGGIYYFQGKYLDALKFFGKFLEVYKNTKNVIDPEDLLGRANNVAGELYNSLGEYTSAYNILSAGGYLNTPLGLLVMTSYDTNQYTQYFPSVIGSLEKRMDTNAKSDMTFFLGEVCIRLNRWYEALEYFSASLSTTKDRHHNQKALLYISEVWKCLKQYKTAVQFSTLVLRSEVETPDTHTGEAHYIIGDCYIRLGLYRRSWSHLHSALCLYQNLPKYRSFVLMLAKVHLSIALLLFKLCRVSESSEHAIKAVQLTEDLISDQEKTTRAIIDINQQALMLRDTVVPGFVFGLTQS